MKFENERGIGSSTQNMVVATIIAQQGLTDRLLGAKTLYSAKGQLGSTITLPWLEERLAGLLRETLTKGCFKLIRLANPRAAVESVTLILDPFLPPPELIILGGGHIAQPLAKMGRLLGYRVVVVDDRPEFVAHDRFPEAHARFCCAFSAFGKSYPLGPQSSVVIVTRGHEHDLTCLRQMLAFPLAYLGMIGSRRKVALFREQLRQEGRTTEELDAVFMPIGLAIKAQTPAEIAVSIAAELILVRRGGGTVALSKDKSEGTTAAAAKIVMTGELPSELDQEILQRILQPAAQQSPAALATVVSTTGSTPRKPGSRMLIWGDGTTLGTIGGGQGEFQVQEKAREIMANHQPTLFRVALDAVDAGKEGMLCGGYMDIFIEPVNRFKNLA